MKIEKPYNDHGGDRLLSLGTDASALDVNTTEVMIGITTESTQMISALDDGCLYSREKTGV